MNKLEMRQKLSDMRLEAGGAVKLAKKLKLKSHSHISAVIRGDSEPGNKLLKAMKLRKMLTDNAHIPRYEDYTN